MELKGNNERGQPQVYRFNEWDFSNKKTHGKNQHRDCHENLVMGLEFRDLIQG